MLAIGLMSGTSLDGVDASLIETDGEDQIEYIQDLHIPYPASFQAELKTLLQRQAEWFETERILTDYHVEATQKLLQRAGISAKDVRVLGFHGQTIFHSPERGITWQIGNPHSLAVKTGIDVVSDFRRRDIALGGQGAPLIPVFHRCLTRREQMPVALLNIGGVANISYIDQEDLIAFDTGPGNALINDVMIKHYGLPYDEDGKIAAGGSISKELLERFLEMPYFSVPPPKSLDRNEFASVVDNNDTNAANLVATLTMLTVMAIKKAFKLLPEEPRKLYVCGGGAKNLTMMKWLQKEIGEDRLTNIKSLGVDPDFVEAQGFAYLAVRYLRALPSSFPTTTGVSRETFSGVLFPA